MGSWLHALDLDCDTQKSRRMFPPRPEPLKTNWEPTHLHAVAYAENGDAALFDQLPHRGADVRRALLVDAVGAATQYDRRQLVLSQLLGCNEARVQLAVDMKLADPTCDEVRVLTAEVENGNLRPGQVTELRGLFEVARVRHGPGMPWRMYLLAA